MGCVRIFKYLFFISLEIIVFVMYVFVDISGWGILKSIVIEVCYIKFYLVILFFEINLMCCFN